MFVRVSNVLAPMTIYLSRVPVSCAVRHTCGGVAYDLVRCFAIVSWPARPAVEPDVVKPFALRRFSPTCSADVRRSGRPKEAVKKSPSCRPSGLPCRADLKVCTTSERIFPQALTADGIAMSSER